MRFLIFFYGGRPPSWICKDRFLWPICIISIPNFIKIGQTVFEISLFSSFEMAAARHLGFFKKSINFIGQENIIRNTKVIIKETQLN